MPTTSIIGIVQIRIVEKAKKIIITDTSEDDATSSQQSTVKSRTILVREVSVQAEHDAKPKAKKVKITEDHPPVESLPKITHARRKKIAITATKNSTNIAPRKVRKPISVKPLPEQPVIQQKTDDIPATSAKPIQFTIASHKPTQQPKKREVPDLEKSAPKKTEVVQPAKPEESTSPVYVDDPQAVEPQPRTQPEPSPARAATKTTVPEVEEKSTKMRSNTSKKQVVVLLLMTLCAVCLGVLVGYIAWMRVQPETIIKVQEPTVDTSPQAIELRNIQRTSRIEVLSSKINEYRDIHGSVPTLDQLNDASWRAWNLFDFDATSICDPLQDYPCKLSSADAAHVIIYQPTTQLYTSCTNDCSKYRLAVHLEKPGSPLYEKSL